MGKTVLPSKFTEWTGLDRISLIVHGMKCIFRELTKDDYGLDGEIEVVVSKAGAQGYETTGGIIKVQAKSGDSYVKQDTGTEFVTPVEKSDLEGWLLFRRATVHPKDSKVRTASCPLKTGSEAITPPPQPAAFQSSTVDLFRLSLPDREQ